MNNSSKLRVTGPGPSPGGGTPPSPPSLPPSPPGPLHGVKVTRMMQGFQMKSHGQGTATDHAGSFTAGQCEAECDADADCESWNWHVTFHGTVVCEHIPAVHCPIPVKLTGRS